MSFSEHIKSLQSNFKRTAVPAFQVGVKRPHGLSTNDVSIREVSIIGLKLDVYLLIQMDVKPAQCVAIGSAAEERKRSRSSGTIHISRK